MCLMIGRVIMRIRSFMRTQIHPGPVSRRTFLRHSALLGGALASLPFALSSRAAEEPGGSRKPGKPIPVILATDIGDDIDDTWALGFLLKCPELDLKLVLTDYGKAQYRAKLLAKFLQVTGHANIPVGIGPDADPRGEGDQAAWVKGYDLGSYPGKIHQDGVQALIDTVMQSKEKMTLICIGPMPNVALALAREPRIARRARIVGMDGSVRKGYGGSPQTCAEWNVKAAPKAAQQVLQAPWEVTITPLDTCGLVTLSGERYAKLLKSQDPIVSNIIDNYRMWSRTHNNAGEAERASSVLFDTVAVYLAFANKLCRMERLGIRVSDDGFTIIDEHAKRMHVATDWQTLDGYRDFLVDRLLS
jgi:inosine-uridine nucleoside N-ribohydrolase